MFRDREFGIMWRETLCVCVCRALWREKKRHITL